MTAPNIPPLIVESDLRVGPFIQGAQKALTAVRDVTDFVRRNGTLTLTVRLAGTSLAGVKTQLAAAVRSQPLPVSISFNQGSVTAAVNSLRAQLSAVVSINTSTVTAVQAQLNAQIAQITALIAQLRALGAGGGAGGSGSRGGNAYSANTKALLADLEKLNNEYKRGDVNASQYAARLTALQASLKTAAAGATAGSAEFRALDTAVTRTVQGLRNVQSDQITRLRTELAGARAQFDAAAAAATNMAQRRAAIAAYTPELNRIRVALQGMASSGQLTAQQLGSVNRMLAQTAREANTIGGGVNLAGLSGNIRNALGQLMQFNPMLAQASGVFGAMPIGVMATVTALAAFTAGMAASFRTAADFQQVMTDIKALTQPTAEGFADLSDAAKTLGGDLGVGPRDTAKAILELNRAGLTATDTINGGLVGALTLAGAAGIDAAKASNLAAAAMTAFKLSAGDMPAIADTFANFSNKTFLGAEDLSQAIAAVGPVARTAGLELNDFAGYMATLAQGGFKNMSDAGTSLKTMLLSLQAPSETAAGAIETLGLNVYDAQGNMLPFADILEQLRTRLAGLTEQQRNNALKDIFGTDGIRAATILLGESRDAIDAMIEAMGLQGEAARVAKERLETYNGAVLKLGASWESFKITVGEKLLPVMTDLVEGLTTGVDTLRDFANGSRSLVPYVAPLVGAFVALRGAAIAAAAPAIWASLLTAIGGFFTTVNAWIAANPFGAIALAVSALAATVNKIMQDTARIYDQVEQANQESFNGLMKRVKALQAEGTELGRVQAKYLLAVQQLQDAQQGDITGVDFWGNITREVDQKKVQEAQRQVTALREEMVVLRTEAGRHGQLKTELGGPGLSPEQLKKREDAIRKLRETMEERAFTLSLEGMSDVDAELARTAREFEKLRAEAAKPFAGNPQNQELLKVQTQLVQQQAAEERAIRAKFRAEEAKEREEEGRKAAEAAGKFATETRRIEVEAWADGEAKKAALRDLEVQDVRAQVAQLLEEYKAFPALREQIMAAGRVREVALQNKWAEEDRREAKARADRIVQAYQAAQASQFTALQAGRQREEAEYELLYARRLAQAQGNAEKEAQIEMQAAQARLKFAQQNADDQYREDRRLLDQGLADALKAEDLSAQERQEIIRDYYNKVGALDRNYQSDYLKRVQEREESERAAAEKIRQARVAAALKPAEGLAKEADRLRFQQQLTDSTAEKLRLEAQVQAKLQQQVQAYQQVLSDSGKVALNETEREKVADDLEKTQQGIATSQREQLRLQKEIESSGRNLVTIYGQVVRVLGVETGVAAAQQEYAEATENLGDAYARALPYLRDFRSESLKPEDYDDAKDAMQGLITALDQQRQKLEALRGEYERQRGALQSVQDVLRGFGQEFGDEKLLENAISINQVTYDDARRALDTLLRGGTYDAAQLAEATQALQGSYNGLKDSVVALGEARAKEHEKEARRIQDEADRQTKLIDAQIKAAKDKGLDTTALEKQRDGIVAQAEAKVDALEAKAEAARQAAQKALGDRTSGLQDLLQGVQQGAARAGSSVEVLAGTIRVAEKDLKDSTARMRASLTSVFTNLPAIAAKAGRDAGQQFVTNLEAQLRRGRAGTVNVAGVVPASAAGGNTNVNFYFNGQQQPTPQELRELARDLTPFIKSEAQRQYPGGPCGGRQ